MARGGAVGGPYKGKQGATHFRGGRGRGGFRPRGGGRGGGGRNGAQGNGAQTSAAANGVALQTDDAGTQLDDTFENAKVRDEIDERLGFKRWEHGASKTGWLVNMHATLLKDDSYPGGRAAVDYYFIEDDGGMFKSTIVYEPYFLIACKKGQEGQVEEWLLKKYEEQIVRLERMRKEDLKLPNHLLGYRRTFIALYFRNSNDMYTVRREILPIAQKNLESLDAIDTYAEVVNGDGGADVEMAFTDEYGQMGDEEEGGYVAKASRVIGGSSPSDFIIDIREYDIPYYLRVAIDKEIRVGLWYTVSSENGEISISCIRERVERAEPVVMAFDIETTKAPLKFPDQQNDQIMMISYMIDGQGFLITNREIVSEDIEDFEYTPKAEYEGPFIIFNEADEAALIRRFFEHIRDSRPTVIATYNGDSFDFPFVEARAIVHGIDMLLEIGFSKDREGEYKSRQCVHMDCFRWVKRDSYLPQGSQGLKAVTVAKLGYNPIELDPELMTPYAQEQPHILSQYSVSDAVATYYLYMKYVHPFVFSLCNIIPLNPDEVLRKGSGTLCETLLMVEAYRGEIIMPNRHVEGQSAMYEGHLLESETYVGGHVEALEAGVFRSDIPVDFRMVPEACQKLIDDLDQALTFSLVEEGKVSLGDVENYDNVKEEIQQMLEELRDNPLRNDTPLIYHLDVAAMYPNIMLSNRLQPDSVVTEAACAACDYNRPGKQCDRRMTWAWRGEYFPAKLDEFKMVRHALEAEMFPPLWKSGPPRRFKDLKPAEQTTLVHKRLGDYSRKVYKKTHETKIVKKEAIICQRENPFYIDTVKEFRDRRYTYKGLHKTWKKNLDKANEGASVLEVVEAKKMIVLYDSLQLAHKCILNSFYGYVMRKGARWHSMEMAGITCLTGASIIQMARKLVEQIGRPLELDTDGIWCMLPSTFPDNFSFKLKGGKKFAINYPCTMLNHLVHADFTNDQYHELVDKERGTYQVKSENSIFFELDGPYRAMILPSSKEEDKLLKKRYAVFNDDGSLAELKGFEVKRRGELQLIKIFQSQIFEQFLLGTNLQECYAEVAVVANQWLDILSTKGASLSDDELVDLIAENRSMSRTLSEYAGQKSTSISTAKRLAEFLGDNMVKDKGLSCRFIVSAKPSGAPVTERAVPVAIFSAEPSIKRHFLRKWLKDNGLTDFDLRTVLDWDYYIERLGSVVQKLITIPAAMQKVANPVPRIRHPDWLLRRVANLEDKFKQHKLEDMFSKMRARAPVPIASITAGEDIHTEEIVPAGNMTPEVTTVEKPRVHKPIPDINVNYSGWLKHQKKMWKQKREERKASAKAGISKTAGQIGTMFSRQTVNLAAHTWEIIQISKWPNGRPGEYKMWLLIGDSLQAVKFRIPRTFYLNFKKLDDVEQIFPKFCQFEVVNRTLPRGQQALTLVSCTTDELSFRENEAAMSVLMNHPDVDGIYETHVPHVVRALTRLGNKCNPDSKSGVSLSRGLDQGFNLDDLATPTAVLNKRKYLDGGRSLKYAYLYHSNQDSRHILCLVLPSGDARLYVVDKGRNHELPNMEKYYTDVKAALDYRRKEMQQNKADAGLFHYPGQLKIDVTFHAEPEAVYRHLNKEFNALHSRRQGAMMVAICSARSRAFYEGAIGSIQQFPIVMLPSSRLDNSYPTRLMWQGPAAKRMVQHYLRLSSTMQDKVETAHRADVPVCNLEGDIPLFLVDIDYARRLTKADVLLWWSPMPRPDLGGRQQDANSQGLTDEAANPEISRAGAYTNASVEVEVRDLAIDAILQSALVYELEGAEGGASIGFNEASHNLDEYAKGTAHAAVVLGDAILPTQIFALVKTMVKHWTTEGAKTDGQHARKLMDHLWRWITSPTSALYDPALQRFVSGLMRKTFSQLLAELRRLGCEVVHANFNRIMLATSKPTPGAAYAYANYFVSSVTSRELFKHVNLRIIDFWSLYVHMDGSNYAGVICGDPLAEDQPGRVIKDNFEMRWLLQQLLPPGVRPHFQSVVLAFLDGLRQNKLKHGDSRSPLRVLPNASQTQPDLHKKVEQDAAKSFVATKLTRIVLKAVETVRKEYADSLVSSNEHHRASFVFPRYPGSTLTTQKVVLEFVKAVCAVLALAKELALEVGVLRKNVLDLIGVREFAIEAAFKQPSTAFKIATTCSHCQLSRDVDLCKETDLLLSEEATGETMLPCPACKHSLDKLAIEGKLVEMMQRNMASYAMQDLRCQRCNQIKASSMSNLCDCSGGYKLETTAPDYWKKIRTIRDLAEFYGLDIVREMAEECLRTA